MIISLRNLSLANYLWHMRFHMFHFESATSTLADILWGMACETDCVCFQCFEMKLGDLWDE
jgi:hypothetical protein